MGALPWPLSHDTGFQRGRTGDVQPMRKDSSCKVTQGNTRHTEALPSHSRDSEAQMQLGPGDMLGKGNSRFTVVLPEQPRS